MNKSRGMRFAKIMVAGAFLLQAGGCTTADVFDLVQTVLLGITAAGAVAILQNI